MHILTVNETVKKPPKKVATSFSRIGGRKNPQKKSLLHSVVREVEKTPQKVRYFILISKKMYDGVGLPCATTAYGPPLRLWGRTPLLGCYGFSFFRRYLRNFDLVKCDT